MKRAKKFGLFGGIFLVLLLVWIMFWGITPKSAVLLISPRLITPVSPLYYIKIGREYLQAKFIFGDQDLSFWNYTLAKKRLAEGQILKKYGLEKAARDQIKLASMYQKKGDFYLQKLIDRIDVNYLIKLRDDNNQTFNYLNSL